MTRQMERSRRTRKAAIILPRNSPFPLSLGDVPMTYRVSAEKNSRRRRSSEMIDNPDTLRVTKSRRALMKKDTKKTEEAGYNARGRMGGNRSADYETRVAERRGGGGAGGSDGFNTE